MNIDRNRASPVIMNRREVLKTGIHAAAALSAGASLLQVCDAFARETIPVLTVSGLGDCEKITKDGAVPSSPHFWDPVNRRLLLDGGRNEMVAVQLILTASSGDVHNLNVKVGDLVGPGVIPANPNLEIFLE